MLQVMVWPDKRDTESLHLSALGVDGTVNCHSRTPFKYFKQKQTDIQGNIDCYISLVEQLKYSCV